MKLLKAIRTFHRGLVDAFGRGKEPDGSFADSRNLIPTKIGSLETVHGYASASLSSHVAGATALPTGFPDVEGNGTHAMTKILADPFCFSSETPSAYDGRVFWMEDEDTNQYVVLDTYFKGSTTKVTSPYNGFVKINERKTVAYSADVTITGTSTHSIVIANAAAKGLSASNDYYNTWVIEWTDISVGTVKRAYVTDYGVTADTATFTVLEDIGSSHCNWLLYESPDDLFLRRWFHGYDQASVLIAFATPPGQTFESQGVVRGCGGGASTAGYSPWWSGYINRTFFNGVAGGAYAYQGTYVDSMEVSPIHAGEYVDVLLGGGFAVDATKVLTAAEYKIAYTLEYDGYQESPLYGECGAGSASNGTDQYVTFSISIQPGAISKRVTAVNIYANYKLGGVTSDYYFIRRVALHNISAAEQAMWAYSDALGYGTFVLDGTGTNTSGMLSGDDWASRGQSYFDRTGREENDATVLSHQIINWQYTETLAGRRFYGSFYDQTALETITDFVRFTPFGVGVPNYDVIPTDRLNYEFEVSSGDPGGIRGFKSDGGLLLVWKDSVIQATFINAYPETWVHQTLSNRDGLYAVKSLVSLPNGGVCFADADHFKLLRNQRITTVTDLIRDTYYNLSGKANIVSWYDKIDGAVCFTNGVDTTNGIHYRCYESQDGWAIYPVKLGTSHYPEFIATERDGDILFTNNHADGFQIFAKWARTAYTFGGNAIIPYLKTNHVIVDESAYTLLDKYVITKSGNASTGTLQTRIYVDTTLSQSFTAEDKAKTTLYQKMKATSSRQGRRVQIEYNYHTTGESLTTAKMQLDGIDIYGEVLIPPESSK